MVPLSFGPESGLTGYHIIRNSSSSQFALSVRNSDTSGGGGGLQVKANGSSSNEIPFQVARYDGTALGICGGAGTWSNISGGSWAAISDSRLKKNVENLENGLATILAMRPVKYAWRDENVSALRPTEHFIAQEVELVNHKWVTEGGTEKITEDGVEVEIENCKQVNLDASFNAYLVKAIQELSAKLDEANAKIAALEAK